MFIGYYETNGKENFSIYYKNANGFRKWQKDTFSPTCENITVLDFKISGETYQERKNNLEELAKDWQLNFAALPWSYSELYEINNYFYENAKRYGLLRTFHENGIC